MTDKLGDNYLDSSSVERYDGGSTSEEESMTLCIAAECDFEGTPAIVLCADWRAQTGTSTGLLIGTEDTYKIREIGCVSALLSGRPSDAHELITDCKVAINNFCLQATESGDADIVVSSFQTALREAAGKRKAKMTEEFVYSALGMAYADFRQTRTEHFTEFHHHIWESITKLDLGTDLIFCGFCGDTPMLIRLDRFGKAPWESNYAIVGEGTEIARAMLCLQEWNYSIPLDHCIYRLYEAKTAAHKANPSSIGAATAFQIMIKGKGRFGMEPGAQHELWEIFDGKHVVPDLKSLRFRPQGGKPYRSFKPVLIKED